MKYIRLIESFSDSFNKKILDFKSSVMNDFKEDIDGCLYYLLDEYKHNFVFNNDSFRVRENNLVLEYSIILNKDLIIKDNKIDKLIEEVKSSISRLLEIEVEFSIQFSNRTEGGSMTSSGIDPIENIGYQEYTVDDTIDRIFTGKEYTYPLIEIRIELW